MASCTRPTVLLQQTLDSLKSQSLFNTNPAFKNAVSELETMMTAEGRMKYIQGKNRDDIIKCFQASSFKENYTDEDFQDIGDKELGIMNMFCKLDELIVLFNESNSIDSIAGGISSMTALKIQVGTSLFIGLVGLTIFCPPLGIAAMIIILLVLKTPVGPEPVRREGEEEGGGDISNAGLNRLKQFDPETQQKIVKTSLEVLFINKDNADEVYQLLVTDNKTKATAKCLSAMFTGKTCVQSPEAMRAKAAELLKQPEGGAKKPYKTGEKELLGGRNRIVYKSGSRKFIQIKGAYVPIKEARKTLA